MSENQQNQQNPQNLHWKPEANYGPCQRTADGRPLVDTGYDDNLKLRQNLPEAATKPSTEQSETQAEGSKEQSGSGK